MISYIILIQQLPIAEAISCRGMESHQAGGRGGTVPRPFLERRDQRELCRWGQVHAHGAHHLPLQGRKRVFQPIPGQHAPPMYYMSPAEVATVRDRATYDYLLNATPVSRSNGPSPVVLAPVYTSVPASVPALTSDSLPAPAIVSALAITPVATPAADPCFGSGHCACH